MSPAEYETVELHAVAQVLVEVLVGVPVDVMEGDVEAVAEADVEAMADADAEADVDAEVDADADADAVDVDPPDPPYGSAITVTVRSCTPQLLAWLPGSHTSTVSFWIQVPMSAA